MIEPMLFQHKAKLLPRGFNLLLLLSMVTLFLGSTAALPPQGPALQATNPALSVEGRLVPGQFVTLSTPASGQVVGLFVREGELVEAGTIILRLGDEEQLIADLATAEFELLSAQQTLDQLDDNTGVELALAQKSRI